MNRTTILAFLFLLLTMTASCATTSQDRLDDYLNAINQHDVDEALSHLTENFRLVFVNTNLSMTNEHLRDALSWDAGANGRVTYELISADADTVVVLLTERNDFFTLLGIEHFQSRNTFIFDENGLLREQRVEPLSNQPSYQEAMQPALEWAATYRPDELAAIYPDGQIIYNEPMARRWVALLREWREATASAD